MQGKESSIDLLIKLLSLIMQLNLQTLTTSSKELQIGHNIFQIQTGKLEVKVMKNLVSKRGFLLLPRLWSLRMLSTKASLKMTIICH